MDVALNGASDAEIGLVSFTPAAEPDWVVQAEKIRSDMGSLKEKTVKLKE